MTMTIGGISIVWLQVFPIIFDVQNVSPFSYSRMLLSSRLQCENWGGWIWCWQRSVLVVTWTDVSRLLLGTGICSTADFQNDIKKDIVNYQQRQRRSTHRRQMLQSVDLKFLKRSMGNTKFLVKVGIWGKSDWPSPFRLFKAFFFSRGIFRNVTPLIAHSSQKKIGLGQPPLRGLSQIPALSKTKLRAPLRAPFKKDKILCFFTITTCFTD